MFKILGVLVALYTLHGTIKGRIFVKSGPWGRVVSREDSPEYFWVVIAIGAGLAIALFFWF